MRVLWRFLSFKTVTMCDEEKLGIKARGVLD
jgi:hypothetical protein